MGSDEAVGRGREGEDSRDEHGPGANDEVQGRDSKRYDAEDVVADHSRPGSVFRFRIRGPLVRWIGHSWPSRICGVVTSTVFGCE